MIGGRLKGGQPGRTPQLPSEAAGLVRGGDLPTATCENFPPLAPGAAKWYDFQTDLFTQRTFGSGQTFEQPTRKPTRKPTKDGA